MRPRVCGRRVKDQISNQFPRLIKGRRRSQRKSGSAECQGPVLDAIASRPHTRAPTHAPTQAQTHTDTQITFGSV